MSEVPVIRVAQAIQFFNGLFSDYELYVEGEVANYSVSRGKFVFFDLKDEEEEARLSCFMMLHQQTVPLEDGMRVVVRARPTIFTKSGKFSLTVQRIEPKGEGSVRRAFELLKAKLEKEGLFAAERKRALPLYPQKVGIVSSANAAGFGDFMRIARDRLPGVQFILANVAVQGVDAEDEVCFGLDYLNSHYALDAIVVIRGGGSMEDLHAFNSEVVARAIVRSKVPVVVGIGHERDITIADYCADVRAATPSNAAQLLVPTKEEVWHQVEELTTAGHYAVESTIWAQRQQVVYQIEHMHTHLERLIQGFRTNTIHCLEEMHTKVQFRLQSMRQRVQHYAKTIDVLSPLRTLERGYSITCTAEGEVVRSVHQVKPGETLTTRLSDGTLTSTTN